MAYRKLGRETRHRRSMLATLTKQLIENERIVTTETRAKEIRKSFDRCITENSDVLQGCVWRINLDEIENIEILKYVFGKLIK